MTDRVDPHYARTEDYRQQLEEIAAADVCPFCPANFNWHPHPILKSREGWFVTKISENYQNAEFHFLLIGEEHKEQLIELTSDDWRAIQLLAAWVLDHFPLKGGGLAMRFGPTIYTGATVNHLHLHLLQPEIDSETGRAKTVWFPFG